ncbi:glutathione S-transferase family protein [Paucibacter sp. APW11]|uniref:Glutathione S-transferase family protein n=1 Tax=Roseateles aquae TaxID=3077235 RepID=A0ABU3PA40_9BURK|nr:glutathione S-transferase family protein [Paucibacter sp. APW11]MDT8998591.1 glutathione S-transferase family protein [Paucibacter sp. APW11]
MNDLILHHYAGSPFSEKMRLIMGFKGLSWHSVTVPVMLPKPDVAALTGGYRRTPFLQIGGDVFCDTALMCRVIEALHPQPSLYPAASAGAAEILAQWADSDLFWAAIPYTMQPAGAAAIFAGAPPEFLQAFAADRAAMTAGMKRPSTRDAAAALASYLQRLEALLADGRPYLLGEQACVADFAVVQSPWYIRRAPPVAGMLAPFTRLAAWYERVAAFGHGQAEKLDSEAAIAIARSQGPGWPVQVEPGLGFEAGQPVNVSATDYASDVIAGKLVGLSAGQITLSRQDERAGTVHVHFPRIGYALRSQDQ